MAQELAIPDGAEIRRRRQQLGLTQAQLAERTDLSKRTIEKFERGGEGVRYPTLGSLADFFECKISDLEFGATSEDEEVQSSDPKLVFTIEVTEKHGSLEEATAAVMAACLRALPQGAQIRFSNSETGSYRITLQMSPENAKRLEQAFREGHFRPVGVDSVQALSQKVGFERDYYESSHFHYGMKLGQARQVIEQADRRQHVCGGVDVAAEEAAYSIFTKRIDGKRGQEPYMGLVIATRTGWASRVGTVVPDSQNRPLLAAMGVRVYEIDVRVAAEASPLDVLTAFVDRFGVLIKIPGAKPTNLLLNHKILHLMPLSNSDAFPDYRRAPQNDQQLLMEQTLPLLNSWADTPVATMIDWFVVPSHVYVPNGVLAELAFGIRFENYNRSLARHGVKIPKSALHGKSS